MQRFACWPAVLLTGRGVLCSLEIAHNHNLCSNFKSSVSGTAIHEHCKHPQLYPRGLNRKSEDPATGVYSRLFSRCSPWEVGWGQDRSNGWAVQPGNRTQERACFRLEPRGLGGAAGEQVQAAQTPGALGSPWDLVACRFGFHRSGLGRESLSDELPGSAPAVGPRSRRGRWAGEPP